jgi:predicted 3-demethylubiquinone-9 3-methyltransferase (glyoxalase superfamily)
VWRLPSGLTLRKPDALVLSLGRSVGLMGGVGCTRTAGRRDLIGACARGAHHWPAGMVLTVDFTLAGQRFQGLNGGSDFRFNEAVSFVIDCDDQAEVDRLWDALTASGGEPGPCGWLKDRFGLSWQIVPRRLDELLNDPDSERAGRWRRCSRWARSRSLSWRTPPTRPEGSLATYVLIHGAGGRGWYWHLVERELRTRGQEVVVTDLPACQPPTGSSRARA